MEIKHKSEMMNMRLKGFTRNEADKWLTAVENDAADNSYDSNERKKWCHNNGFITCVANRYGIDESNKNSFVSVYDYGFIYPVNDIFRKWLVDRVTTSKVLKPFKKYLPTLYFQIYERDLKPLVFRLNDCTSAFSDDIQGVFAFIRHMGKIGIAGAEIFSLIDKISFNGTDYFFNRDKVSEDELLQIMIRKMKFEPQVIMECIGETADDQEKTDGILRLIAYNRFGDDPKVGQAYYVLPRQRNEIKRYEKADFWLPEDVKINNKLKTNPYIEDNFDNSIKKKLSKETLVKSNFLEDQTSMMSSHPGRVAFQNIYLPVDLGDGSLEKSLYVDEDNRIQEGSIDSSDLFADAKIPHWKLINNVIKEISMFIPQIELMGVDIVITKESFKIVRLMDHPYYPLAVGFNEEMTSYFRFKTEQKTNLFNESGTKKETLRKRVNNSFWTRVTKLIAPSGMRPLIYKWWIKTMFDDLCSLNGLSIRKKIWAYRKGFLSYRLEQYGIDKENYRNFISDYDYRFLRHINNKYKIWLEDKLTVKYICSEHNQFFPAYYYHFAERNGEVRLIKLMDLPAGYDNKPESILALVRDVGDLACKPQRGSQGEGFFKLSYDSGKYFMNHEEVKPEEVISILSDGKNQYFITGYIKQHNAIDKIYSGAVNTMRVITFMKDGKTPVIGNAYMRFGSKETGAVDNMGAGGMFAQIDMETGRFHNGKIITGNKIINCERHPDSGELIEGVIPHWDKIKDGVRLLCMDMPQLEYLGFDIAVTENGMNLPEINRAPGYPKIEKFNPLTTDYLLYKKDKKMERIGIKKTKW